MQSCALPSVPSAQQPLLSPRVDAFRQSLIQAIPHHPNAMPELEAMMLPSLAQVYINWAHRIVTPRKRIVSYQRDFWSSPLSVSHSADIERLAWIIADGTELKPYMSKHPFTAPGFVAGKGNNRATAWQRHKEGKKKVYEKDSCLNAYELHHLHLGKLTVGEEFCSRKDEPVVFVHFTQTTAHFVFIGTHEFHTPALGNAVAVWNAVRGNVMKGLRVQPDFSGYSEEDQRQIENAGFCTMRVVDGYMVPAASQAMSGDGLRAIQHSAKVLKALYHGDPKIDDPNWVTATFATAPLQIPDDYRLTWIMSGSALGLLEKNTRQCAILVPGLN